jgi:hypothetical protein
MYVHFCKVIIEKTKDQGRLIPRSLLSFQLPSFLEAKKKKNRRAEWSSRLVVGWGIKACIIKEESGEERKRGTYARIYLPCRRARGEKKQDMAAKNGRDVNFSNMEYVDVDISKIGEAVCSSSDKRK